MSFQSFGLAYDVPAYARHVLGVLEAAGYEAWVVGGWVRDALLSAPCHDVDLTTNALWQQTESALVAAGVEVHETGTAHGTVTAVFDGKPIEITTYRTEGSYSDHRHPDEVTFVRDVREDLARRDLTINAMAYHPERGLLDPFGGRDDLARGMVRAVGDPAKRFEEDALRVLRAVRFAARLGFRIEPATQAALVDWVAGLRDIAHERIGRELTGILRSGRVSWALMSQTPVMVEAIPELEACVGFDQQTPYHAYDVLEHTARVCRGVEEFTGGIASDELRWAALLHDIAKPRTFTMDENGRGHFYGHPKVGAQMARTIMHRLAIPRDLTRKVCALVRLHDRPTSMRKRSVYREMMELEELCPGEARSLALQLTDLKRADAVSKTPSAASYAVELDRIEALQRRLIAGGVCLTTAELAVGGGDVIREMGVKPGPQIGVILRDLLRQVSNGMVPNERDALLDRLRQMSGV